MSKAYNRKGKGLKLAPIVNQTIVEMIGQVLLFDTSCTTGEVYHPYLGEIYIVFTNEQYLEDSEDLEVYGKIRS